MLSTVRDEDTNVEIPLLLPKIATVCAWALGVWFYGWIVLGAFAWLFM